MSQIDWNMVKRAAIAKLTIGLVWEMGKRVYRAYSAKPPEVPQVFELPLGDINPEWLKWRERRDKWHDEYRYRADLYDTGPGDSQGAMELAEKETAHLDPGPEPPLLKKDVRGRG
ncbi:MAG: hypothetical protein ACKO38_03500 [Planctomycetota bacterium]